MKLPCLRLVIFEKRYLGNFPLKMPKTIEKHLKRELCFLKSS